LRALYGIATYDDNFVGKRQHLVKFCYTFEVASAAHIQINNGAVSTAGITPTPEMCPYWNCTEEDCKSDKERYEKQMAADVRAKQPQPKQ
ncbi:MAG: hypothetical protein WCA78_16120, partial [Rhizomicrobium sp.]